jgi:hypothetical protein
LSAPVRSLDVRTRNQRAAGRLPREPVRSTAPRY